MRVVLLFSRKFLKDKIFRRGFCFKNAVSTVKPHSVCYNVTGRRIPVVFRFSKVFLVAVMLIGGKTRYPRWILLFHPVTWNILLAVIPDITQAMQVPVAAWMAVMSQSSTNSAIVIWCIAAAICEKKHI